ncbi:MAG: DUF268 domain-containing protein [Candidatus Absconditabacterales bacterium]
MGSIINKVKGLIRVIKDYFEIKKQLRNNKDFKITKFLPIISDKFDSSGVAKGSYFHQDLLVARKIFENNPVKHVDIGSRIDGFVAHVATFREIEIFDIRALKNKVKNITFRQADLMEIDKNLINYCDSISSLSVIEHFGLGRYGDKINSNGDREGLENIYKILKKGGKFYFSVPIGPQRIEFNAHRAYSIKYLLDIFKDKYILSSFSYTDDNGDLHENITLDEKSIKNNCNCNFGHGIFELTKI